MTDATFFLRKIDRKNPRNHAIGNIVQMSMLVKQKMIVYGSGCIFSQVQFCLEDEVTSRASDEMRHACPEQHIATQNTLQTSPLQTEGDIPYCFGIS